MGELQRLNKGVSLDRIRAGQTLRVPPLGIVYSQRREEGGTGAEAINTRSAQNALIHASAVGETPKNGLVAVKAGLVSGVTLMRAGLNFLLNASCGILSVTQLII